MAITGERPESPAFVLRGHQVAVLCTDFAPSPANVLVSGDVNGTCILWNLHTFFPIAKWSPHPREVLYCTFLTSDRLLTMGRNDGICIWDTSAAVRDSIPMPAIPDPTMRPEFCPKLVFRMELLSVGFCPCHVVPVREPSGTTSQVLFLISCPAADSTSLFDVYLLNIGSITTGSRFTCLLRNVGNMPSSPALSSTPISLPVSTLGLMIQLHWIQGKDGQLALLAAYDAGKVAVWGWPQPLDSGIPPRSAPVPLSIVGFGDSEVAVTAIAPDVKGKIGWAGNAADEVWMFEIGPTSAKPSNTAPIVHLLDAPPPPSPSTLAANEASVRPIASIAVRGDNKRLAWGRHDGRVTLRTRNGQVIGDLVFHGQAVRHVAFSRSADVRVGGEWMLACASDDTTVSLWRAIW